MPKAPTVKIISTTLPEAFHPGWNKLPGFTATGRSITIHPATFFYKYDNPAPEWLICDWVGVRDRLLPARETGETTVEQMALDYVRAHARTTHDAAEVLRIAWEVYSFLFRESHLADPALQRMGVEPRHLRVLREMACVMALNRVETNGAISNVNPSWLFGIAAKVVYDLSEEEATSVDELYHGTWFNEPRRIEQVLAHAALGGRLVHGCQSSIYVNMAGGAILPFGADVARFQADLARFKDDWVEKIEACANK
ncbi:hypothetical protein RIF23_10505 [Lipingzhangella sp. LS1_29]|uniref:Uncharacterized protein n=1 Tax=Lipingzhangella rawalii TaxID=2055835 RepID=A0ABU2H613_9ACTN|nr:hypothetical protein [Lipingzhangella rawalii]MDS1270730.1 hypothetical protein [Lipingzhangella rawalii]